MAIARWIAGLAASCMACGRISFDAVSGGDGGSGFPDAALPPGSSGIVPVTDGINSAASPAIASTSAEFVVAWVDDLTGTPAIRMVHFDANGAATSSLVTITPPTRRAGTFEMVSTGTELGFAWSEFATAGESDVYFMRTDLSGMQLGTIVQVSNANGESIIGGLVWDGSGYALVWSDGRDPPQSTNREIYFSRLDATGNVLVPETRITNTAALSNRPRIAWSGTTYGVGWTEGQAPPIVYFETVNLGGAVVMAPASLNAATTDLDLAFTNTFALVWTNARLELTTVDATGAQGPVVPIPIGSNPSVPNVLWNGDVYGIACSAFTPLDDSGWVLWAEVDASGGTVRSSQPISEGHGWTPKIAWNGDRFGIVWQHVVDSTATVPIYQIQLRLVAP